MRLLLRFWDVDAGAITVGGHDLRDPPQAPLRDLITFVPQDTYLAHASVADNIRSAGDPSPAQCGHPGQKPPCHGRGYPLGKG